MVSSVKCSAGSLSSFFRLLLCVAGFSFCMPLSGEQFDIQKGQIEQHTGQQHALINFSETAREISERRGPPGAFRAEDNLQMLPLSHHSLWNRLRDGFEFAKLEHPKIDLQIEFLQEGMRSLHANLNAARPYLRYIVEQVERADMPIDIAMLPLVESAFNPHAESSQRALGLWQFIPGTGELYGLEETDWYSGRKDVIASTEAALAYLRRLHKTFDGDWLLALAAYNTGQGNVRSAIRSAKKQGLKPDFWNLRLAKETRDYVPRLIAVAKMISEPEAYGIILPLLPDQKSTRTIHFDAPVTLQAAADESGVGLQQLLELNPGYKKQEMPPEGPHRLLVPIEGSAAMMQWKNSQLVTDAAATTPEPSNNANAFTPFKRVDYNSYIVKKGDNLWNIARQFDTDLETLTTWNLIGSRSKPLQPGDKLWYARLKSEPAKQARLIRYRVVTSDTIPTLSKKFNTRLSELKKWNRSLHHSHALKPGQILNIPLP